MARGQCETGFQEEWYTTEDDRHRIHISVRDGFAGRLERRVCEYAAQWVSVNTSESLRIVSLFHDDTHGCLTLFAGSDVPEDAGADPETCLSEMFGRIIQMQVNIVPVGRRQSDHYDHADHIRRQVSLLEGRG